jgi:hypothetical protein
LISATASSIPFLVMSPVRSEYGPAAPTSMEPFEPPPHALSTRQQIERIDRILT